MYKIMRSGQQKRLKRMYADLAKVTGRKNGFGGWFNWFSSSSSPRTPPPPKPFERSPENIQKMKNLISELSPPKKTKNLISELSLPKKTKKEIEAEKVKSEEVRRKIKEARTEVLARRAKNQEIKQIRNNKLPTIWEE